MRLCSIKCLQALPAPRRRQAHSSHKEAAKGHKLLDPARDWGLRSKILLLLGCGCLLLLWPWVKVCGDTPGSLSNAAELPLGLSNSSGAHHSLLPHLKRFGMVGWGLMSPDLRLEQEMPVCWGMWALQDTLHRVLTSMSRWKEMG